MKEETEHDWLSLGGLDLRVVLPLIGPFTQLVIYVSCQSRLAASRICCDA